MVTLTESGGRFYGDGLRYVDIDTRKTYQKKTHHPRYGDIYTDVPINSILTIRGGVNLDRLELSEGLDAVGAVLFGGWVDTNGNVSKEIGLYARKRSGKRPEVRFNEYTGVYTIYHYIGHNSYLPIVTPSENAWADSPRVLDMQRDYFTMAFFNNNNEQQKWRQRFTFICYKSV